MKKVLFFLFAVLTLSSCQKFNDDFQLIQNGKIEKIENNNLSVNGENYRIDGDVKDYLLENDLNVGDQVVVYSDGEDFLLSKVDLRDAFMLIKELSFFGVEEPMDIVFVILTMFLLFLLVILLLSLVLLPILWLCDYFFQIDDVDPFLLSARCVTIVCFVLALLFNFGPKLHYENRVQVESISEKMITLRGQNYPKDKIKSVGLKLGTNYFMYSCADEYFLVHINSLNDQQPESLVQAVNKYVNRNAWVAVCFFMIVLVFLFASNIHSLGLKLKDIYDERIIQYRTRRYYKRRCLEEEVDASGGHGSFVKK